MTAHLPLRAVLCGVAGSRAGCGPCVVAAGHATERDHQDADGQRFEVLVRCPYCAALAREGAEIAAHRDETHGGSRWPTPTPTR